MNPDSLNFLERAQNAGDDRLWSYIQAMGPEAAAQLSKPSPEAAQLMERHLASLVGVLPSGAFDVNITASREHLGQLLASAMMNGYFLHAAEQRLQVERSLQAVAELDGE